MASTSNKMSNDQVQSKLVEIESDRKKWEFGSYKNSNEELYGLLGKCASLMSEMSGSRALIKPLNEMLTLRGIKYNDGTSLATKIVRFAFGDCGKRAYTYARVLTVAASEKTEKESFAAFVARKGGIEALRKAPKPGEPTKAELAKKSAAVAETYFADSDALVSNIACSAPDVHPHSEASHQFSAALLRKDDDGTFSIVYGCNRATVVKLLLAEGGKVADSSNAARAAADQRKQKRNAREKALKAAA
jgi:hypothetical protein